MIQRIPVEMYLVDCTHCDKYFFENTDLKYCPHCNSEIEPTNTGVQLPVFVELDPITGICEVVLKGVEPPK